VRALLIEKDLQEQARPIGWGAGAFLDLSFDLGETGGDRGRGPELRKKAVTDLDE